ncbi:MAG: ribosome silencing factor [Solobacterium sp.]|nr:ribosome silencing factor [Solobacterium sp.]
MSELLDLVRKTLDDKQAENITVLDMREVNPFTDYFVICTAKNLRHANALADFIEEEALKNGFDIRSREGEKESTWILVDLFEVVVHIFTQEARNTYRLEALWADRPVVE